MTYNAYEVSNEGGKPVALYQFQYGNSYHRFTTNDEDLELGVDDDDNPIIWTAKAITDDGVTQGGSDQNDLQIVIANVNPISDIFRNGQPSGKVWLTVRRYHLGDPDSETPLLWSGSVINAVYEDQASDRLMGRSLSGTYDKNGLRLAWTRMCPHPLYGVGCFVDKSLHAYPRTIATLTGVTFTCTAHSEPEEGSFTGGFMEWERTDGSLERRAIEFQDGNDFLIMGSTTGLEIGSEVTLYPGCPRNTTGCILFDNLANYGGFPHLPGKSPFDGTPVF